MNKATIICEIKRYLVLIVGFFIMSIGVALSTKANLGTSPVSSIPYVGSMFLPLTMGQLTIIMSMIYILLQIVLLRSQYELVQLFQIVIAVIFGYFTDFSLFLFRDLSAVAYYQQWLLCIVSVVLIAFGVFIEVKVNRFMLAGEGVMAAISRVTHADFSRVKIMFDCVQVVVAIVLAFMYVNQLAGVREGTIFAAICVGMVVRVFDKLFSKMFDRFFEPVENVVLTNSQLS